MKNLEVDMKPVLVVDGQNLAYAANFTRPLSTKLGYPTQAILGFLRMLGGASERFQPVDIYVTWDTARSKKRLELWPEYKGNRDIKKKDPKYATKMEELDMQIPVIQKLIGLLGIKQITSDELEGDDAIAVVVKAFRDADRATVIVSGDHDFLQLVDFRTSLFNPINNGSKIKYVKLDNFGEATGGLTPSQYLEYKALVGDTSDNIPGAKGVGKKTAMKLLKSHGSYVLFQKAYEDDPKSFGHLACRAYEDSAGFEMSKKLMDLRNPMIDEGASREVSVGLYDPEKLKETLDLLEFTTADAIIESFATLWNQ
jgi:DNA polymerase-1